MSTKIIFRSGLRTIGGTIIEMIDENNRLIFDFGTVFDGKLGAEELPKVDGVYENNGPLNTAILISHLHLDHTKAMNLVDNEIPIYMSEKSHEFIKDLYNLDFEDFKGTKRQYTPIDNQEIVNFGNFRFSFLEVDHDVIGASAILVQTEHINLLYSGDLRINGYDSQKTYNMIKYINSLDKKIDVAIFEGVTISFIEDDYKIIPTNKVETLKLESEFSQLVNQTLQKEKLILVNPYIMGLERIKSIIEYTKNSEKKLCVTPKFSYLINKYYEEFDFKILEEDKYKTNKEVITYKDLSDEYIIFFDYENKEKYIEVLNKYKGQSALIQTGGEPLGEFDDRWQNLIQFSNDIELNVYLLGASGHASPENLLYIIEQIDPKILMPLHSFKPELVKSQKDSIEQILPEENKEYIFENNQLKR